MSFVFFLALATVFDESRKSHLISFIIWRIILRYQIFDEVISDMKVKDLDYKKVSKSLMKWVHSKIPDHKIENFTRDWTNGIALCHLVNAIRKDSIPGSMFENSSNAEMNLRLACTTAEDELGVLELIAPYDIANGKVNEKSMMTYIALFRSADRMIKRGISTRTYTSDVSPTSESESDNGSKEKENANIKRAGIAYQKPRCIAFGAGLRWGQVGKPTEFIVRLNGAQASDLSVSIECRPYDHRAAKYKPELQIKPIGNSSYMVRYTPTRPGEYVLSIFCAGDHISGSPFRLSVQESVLHAKMSQQDDITITLNPSKVPLTTELLTKSLESNSTVDSKHESGFFDDDTMSLRDTHSPPPWLDRESHDIYTKVSKFISSDNSFITAYGKGLHMGEVGKISYFNVRTPNTDNGPLSVTITCPAMSLPVPCVKTRLQHLCLVHDVLYLPTEPGVYEIIIEWGEKQIDGSPFRLIVKESNEERSVEQKTDSQHKVEVFRDTDQHTLYLYYSASTEDATERHYKDQLQKLLETEAPLDKLIKIAVDIELTRNEREKLFRKADTRKLPILFRNDTFLGTYHDVLNLYKKTGVVNDIKETMKRTLSRLSSSGGEGVASEIFE